MTFGAQNRSRLDCELDQLATDFLRQHEPAPSPEPSSQIFKIMGRSIGGSGSVPLSAFLVPPRKIKGKIAATPCADCGGPRSHGSGQRCEGCYKAGARKRFIEKQREAANDRSHVEPFVHVKRAFEWADDAPRAIAVAAMPFDDVPSALTEAVAAAIEHKDCPRRLRRLLRSIGEGDRLPRPRKTYRKKAGPRVAFLFEGGAPATCPRCASGDPYKLKYRPRLKCRDCGYQYSSKPPLQASSKMAPATWDSIQSLWVAGICDHQIHRRLDLNYRTVQRATSRLKAQNEQARAHLIERGITVDCSRNNQATINRECQITV